MLHNYLTIALRFFSRRRSFSIINIAGLTIGVACSLLIFLYVHNEVQYDRFHTDAERIYRLGFQSNFQGKEHKTTLTGFPVGEVIQSQTPLVESVQRLAFWKTFPVRYDTLAFTEPHLLLADSEFFSFFSFKLVQGNPDSVLHGDRKVVITESAAKRYFNYKGRGDTSPIGKTIILAQGYEARITGIAEDPPVNSHFHFSLILSLSSWEGSETRDWLGDKVITYYKLKKEAEAEEATTQITRALQTRVDAELRKLRNTNIQEYKKQGTEVTYFQQPLTSIHLHSHIHDEIEINGSFEYILLFTSVAIFITLLACINFMNLTTAQSSARAKEVAVRKTVGAQNERLIIQFLFESYIYIILAVIIAAFLVFAAITPFNFFSGQNLSFSGFFNKDFIIGLFAFIFIVGLVAGSYPAFYLSRFNPVEVLKGSLRRKGRTFGIRNILVVFQFFISASLIIATLIVYQQLQFIQHIDVGFNRENIVNLLHTKNLGNKAADFKSELLSEPGVVSASYCNRLPPYVTWQSIFRPMTISKDYSLAVYEMDYDHLETMGFQMKSGRFFSPMENDSLSVIINETAANLLKLQDFSSQILFTTYDQPAGKQRKIIGVVKDFNFLSLKEPVQPLALILGYEPNWEMAIRIKGNKGEVITRIRNLYHKYAPDAPFEYSWVVDNFELQHETEKRVGVLFIVFTILAILIACLGLFGLATFTAEQQKKAIGIRKVLGASINSIVTLLNKEFLTLVLMANVLAWPITWIVMEQWLQQFPYHISVPWWTFVISALITFSIAFLSVSFKALNAARVNPVNSLRSE